MLKAFKSSSASHKPKPVPQVPVAGTNVNTPRSMGTSGTSHSHGSSRRASSSSSHRPTILVNTNLSRTKSVKSVKSVSSSKSNASINSNKSYNSMSSAGSSSITTVSSAPGKHSSPGPSSKHAAAAYPLPVDSPLVPNYTPYKFLIVDDNLINLKILYKILSKIFPNSLVIKLTNSSTVLKLMEREKFDLVFLDIEMPPINGVEITKRIRAQKKFSHIGLIAVTTKSNEKDVALYKKIGIDFTFKKPMNYKLDVVLNNVEVILNYRKRK